MNMNKKEPTNNQKSFKPPKIIEKGSKGYGL